MNRFLIYLSLTVSAVTMPVNAQTSEVDKALAKAEAIIKEFNSVTDDVCTDIHDVAKAIMTKRQSGLSIVETMEWVKKAPSVPDDMRNFSKEMVKDAYSTPKYSSERYQKDAVRKYSEKAYIGCAG